MITIIGTALRLIYTNCMPVNLTESREHIITFLHDHGIGVLATADKTGAPYASTIYLTHDNDLNIYFLTKTNTQKARNLQHNPQAAIAVYEAEAQKTLQITGQVQELTDGKLEDEVFRRILHIVIDTSNEGIPPIARLKAGSYVIYKLVPVSMRLASFSPPAPGRLHEIFEIA